ncbi:hypothetical protein BT69DRAFT_1288545 [Atractiella rhizophila]|nr:hypothetical protein BT69DRAFT_1288545 [Atractiella rhizophila]
MNATEEVYVWRKASSKLYSLADFNILHGSSSPEEIVVIVFPAASYQRVLDMNGVEYFPSSSDGLVWLRVQSCVCQNFDIQNKYKRPAVIRKHFISCRLRAQLVGENDPIKTCCLLWDSM